MKPNENNNPILIPEECILEGFIKTKKSIRIESNFYGILLSTEKVIIDKTSKIEGDIVCSELIISGSFVGNIFCTGKLSVTGSAQISGQVYTKLFQNEENCDLNCLIQIPNNTVINAIQDILKNIDSSTKLSNDNDLKKIIQLFKDNVFSSTDESKKMKEEEVPSS